MKSFAFDPVEQLVQHLDLAFVQRRCRSVLREVALGGDRCQGANVDAKPLRAR